MLILQLKIRTNWSTMQGCLEHFSILIVVVIMFDQILRVFAGTKLGQDAIAFNVISIKGASKLPRYEPFQYTFIPSGEQDPEALETIVKFVNLTVFGHPGIFLSSHRI